MLVSVVSAFAVSRSVPLKRVMLFNNTTCSSKFTLFEYHGYSEMVCLSVCAAEIQC